MKKGVIIFKLQKYSLFGIIVVLILMNLFYFDFIIRERNKLQEENYKIEASLMQKKLKTLISAKQNSTGAIALSIANDKELQNKILQNDIPKNCYDDLILKFNKNTLYKNIWVQVFDKDLNSIYKSWNTAKGENKKDFRDDIAKAIELAKPLYSINYGNYDLSIRAIVPIFRNNENIGAIEVISHFNSISKEMRQFDVDSIVVLKKEYNKHLKEPFTNIFIGEYYVANFDAPDDLREYLKKEGVENYFNNSYKIKDNRLITSYEIKGMDEKAIGYYIMFKKLDTLSDKDLDFFMFKWLALSAFGVLFLGAIIGRVVYHKIKKQKMYYQNIIDSSSNIVVVLSRDSMVDVNRIFFKYFYKYNTLEEFKKEYGSISELFVNEEGFVYKNIDGLSWIDYLIKNPKNNQVKIIFDDKEYYFTVGISSISEEEGHYSAIFSDITKEKVYQKELEQLSITDSLTKVGNRHHYNEQIKKEIISSNRYFYPLSLVIFDIDHFKKINDEYGHDVGDKILIEYADLINSSLRKGDILCRIGGEEFALILSHTNKENAYNIVEKLRVKIEEYKEVPSVTMSFGVTEYVREESLESFFKRADEALYEAKNSGRNRVVVK